MSKLNIMDLEKIRDGKIVRCNFGFPSKSEKEITLQLLNVQLKDLRYIRNYILDTFKKDVRNKFDRMIGDRIEEHRDIDFDPRMLFMTKYLSVAIPTMLGDTSCLLSNRGIESASFESRELKEKVEAIFPYVQ